MGLISPLQTTYLNPGIVSAESSPCATIHWGLSCVLLICPPQNYCCFCTLGSFSPALPALSPFIKSQDCNVCGAVPLLSLCGKKKREDTQRQTKKIWRRWLIGTVGLTSPCRRLAWIQVFVLRSTEVYPVLYWICPPKNIVAFAHWGFSCQPSRPSALSSNPRIANVCGAVPLLSLCGKKKREDTQRQIKKIWRRQWTVQTTYLNPRIVSAESSPCATIHWGLSCVLLICPPQNYCCFCTLGFFSPALPALSPFIKSQDCNVCGAVPLLSLCGKKKREDTQRQTKKIWRRQWTVPATCLNPSIVSAESSPCATIEMHSVLYWFVRLAFAHWVFLRPPQSFRQIPGLQSVFVALSLPLLPAKKKPRKYMASLLVALPSSLLPKENQKKQRENQKNQKNQYLTDFIW